MKVLDKPLTTTVDLSLAIEGNVVAIGHADANGTARVYVGDARGNGRTLAGVSRNVIVDHQKSAR